MSADEQRKKCPPKGLPPWMATFADLMSLLLSFFVLLLSFSEMDVQKYKQIAGSLKFAFGVQREVKAEEPPKGTSIIAKEFSPGKPTPTTMKVMRQQTTDDVKRNLDFTEAITKTRADASKIEEALEKEIEQELIQVDTVEDRIIIRIRERASFPSGGATTKGSFGPIMDKISAAVNDTQGEIIIAGHTDNIPIATRRFRSNWELSSARAVTVLHELINRGDLDPERLEVKGLADTEPVASNDTPEGRAKNRRVELVIDQGRLPDNAPRPSSPANTDRD